MSFNPADTWKASDTIIKLGMKSHYKTTTTFAFRKADNSLATMDEGKMPSSKPTSTRYSTTFFEQDHPITYSEFEVDLNDLANNKSPERLVSVPTSSSHSMKEIDAQFRTALLSSAKAETMKVGILACFLSSTNQAVTKQIQTIFVALTGLTHLKP